MTHDRITKGALTYLVNDDGVIISEGYHDIRRDGQSGRRGGVRKQIRTFDPYKAGWGELEELATGHMAGQTDDEYWCVLDGQMNAISEPYERIWTDDTGSLRGARNGSETSISTVGSYQPALLPGGVTVENPDPHRTEYVINGDTYTAHTIFVRGDTLYRTVGAREYAVDTLPISFTPPLAPNSVIDQTTGGVSDTQTVPQQSASQDAASIEADRDNDTDSAVERDSRNELSALQQRYVDGEITIARYEELVEDPLTEQLERENVLPSPPAETVLSNSDDAVEQAHN